ncbi:vWA domain-containing protein [Prevotella sp. P2-180]|uniref:vWA domain-containing protein n=1 Tax=Prevotella sp. P2-180 TaxID=2024224 RepID=UPI0011406C83|nr:vWA domain-containing protein [Prevotella sp. P2-180]
MKKQLFSLMIAAGLFSLASCTVEDNGSTGVITVPGIPADTEADPNPTLPDAPNTNVANINYVVETASNGNKVIRFDLTGIQSPENPTEWLRLYGTNTSEQNIWISIDDLPKGFTIENTIDSEEQVSAVDLVFLVDNSGSMGEEADAVAKEILDWSKMLSKTLDMRFGCVGYDYGGEVNGAINMCGINEIDAFLNRSGKYGIDRTMGFEGPDKDVLAKEYARYSTGTWSADECGVSSLRYADDLFNFRKNTNRVYVNFTDEPNYPQGHEPMSTQWVKDPNNWPTTKGTIHTIYSSTYVNWTERPLWEEYPWNLSAYTGGTEIKTNSSFSGVSLSTLPITGALQNSYIIKFTNVESLFDGQPHKIKITILSPNGTVRAEKEYVVTFKL